MKVAEIRDKFLEFFEDRDHRVVESSSLLDEDPSVLFTTAGMQQFKPYYLEQESPYGSRVTSCQKCLRTSDIEQVGDLDHLTFMEMLGNFSFGYPEAEGSYFKEKAIKWSYEFLVEECGLEPDKIWLTYYEGSEDIPTDEKTPELGQELGIPEQRISGFGEDNFWGPTGEEGPCGPTAELHYDLTGEPCGPDCKPNDECGRFVEVWNLVFNQYYQDRQGNFEPLQQKGIDTGMGLERLAFVIQQGESIFQTDLFRPIVGEIEKLAKNDYQERPAPFRIIADHIRASVFLAEEGVTPSNKEEGYILRRLLRRAIRFKKLLGIEQENFLPRLAKKTIELYQNSYQFSDQPDILTVIQKEEEKFEQALDRGLDKLNEMLEDGEQARLSGEQAFDLYQSYGLPLALVKKLGKERGFEVDSEGFQQQFEQHKRISRAGAEKKFSGVGTEKIEDEKAEKEAEKLHTATHLLHQALRNALGDHVVQKGSDVTPRRLRFDFSSKPLKEEEIEQVEDLVNEKIERDLEVSSEQMDYEEAVKQGALHLPDHDYPSRVTVYSIGDFSQELCRGPHVEHTGVLGKFKITKEQSSAAGVRRIKAVLE
ncbi:hypothetical protein AKJ56_00155 [candidate division MSBL1 archaeon SCGC-AAA382N08]|uniref:alanine--tRNA ligase n=1 Tax=candidate division MSBL1 archaeon SCGC-AAA382N08 TaxID=1698285 RepID=A0A133VR02_9EURY|nr:hypothetical protein AKJ56_00155 [candidate division MSBL1 archaeon SCGC-AAA382N08]